MRITFRQGLITSEVDVGGNPNYLTLDSAGVTIRTSNKSATFTVAEETKNYTVGITTPVLGWPTSVFSGISTAWLYVDINKTTSARSFGLTTLPPIYSSVAPTNPANDQHWFDTNAKTMKVYNNVSLSWLKHVRLIVGKFAAGAVECVPFGTQAGITGNFITGSIVVDGLGRPIKDSTGLFLTTEDTLVVAGAPTYAASIDTNVIIAQAAANIPAYYVVAFDDEGQLVLANYDNVGSSTIGIVVEPTAATEPANVILDGKVFNPDWNWSGPNVTLWVGANGELVTDDPYTSNGFITQRPPIARTIDANTIMLAPGLGIAAGVDGAKGDVGPAGLNGADGAPGPAGPQGQQGEPGASQNPTDLPVYNGTLTGAELISTVKNDESVAISAGQIVNVATAAIVDTAPTSLNTLKKLATAVNNDPAFATTTTTALATKVAIDALAVPAGSNLIGYDPGTTYVAGTAGERLRTVDAMETQFDQIQAAVNAITADPTNSVTSWTVQAKSFDIVQGSATYGAITNRMGAWTMPYASASYIAMVISLPAHWAKMDVYLQWVNTAANAGNVVLGGEIHKWAIGETINATPTGGSGIIPANPTPWIATETKVAADLVLDPTRSTTLRIARQGASANDNLANGIAVLAVRLVKKV